MRVGLTDLKVMIVNVRRNNATEEEEEEMPRGEANSNFEAFWGEVRTEFFGFGNNLELWKE
ncbi:predicted protein [Sclerotinia sclerotiorum 1980 UF-70]|uniref:Uncharacterized protein n=1 Tax=Sclerotinia sclerotiorum (strain ATCC 18683 / 1980 / Ss-1) TaxID=665079 RepID=A7F9C1_SCLS1|nr:predicted protein [Sclerotinia sclerotiorum 1980 UF-70]EDO00332.1 predicted protein [Sclerotinia sclerotiorum 1980 UF-70]